MNEILVVELKIPWRYDLSWENDEIDERRIEWLKQCVEDACATEAILVRAETGVGKEEYGVDLLKWRKLNSIRIT